MIEGHGDDLHNYRHPIRANFSSNLTDWIDPVPLKAYLQQHVGEALSVYPEPQPYTFEARLAGHLGIHPGQVCATAGATEAIYLVAQSLGGGLNAVLQPTFSEYADACLIHGQRTVSLYRLPEDGTLPGGIRTLWLCNPNNPTGSVVPKEAIARLAEKNPHVLLVIDQSYEGFTLQPLFTAREAAEIPNLLLIHSMTKRYAMPGLRLGYLTGDAPLIRQLRTHRMPWSVNGVALMAGMFLLDRPDAMPFDIAGCLKETARLQALLRAAGGMDVWDTETHFMLVRLRLGQASALKEYLANEHGLLIRDASNFEGLDSTYFRVSTQRPEENGRLAEAVRQWLML